jgi:CheR methyltransferase, SAM binding domain
VIFLRNVLIYFDLETRREVLRHVRGVLRRGGFLLLGAAESTLGLEDSWERMKVERSTIYRFNARGGSMRALVIDDSATMRRIVADMLGELGFDTSQAANGREALDMLEAGGPSTLPTSTGTCQSWTGLTSSSPCVPGANGVT